MVSTTKLFDLFFKTGLLKYESITALDLLKAMDHVDSVRSRPSNKFFECVHTNEQNDLIAYISSAPCFGGVWLMSHHCSIVKGHGMGIMVDVMRAVVTNDAVKYVIGIFNPKYESAARIWELAYEIMGNTEICDLSHYVRCDGALYSFPDTPSKLYIEAFKQAHHKIAEENMPVFAHAKKYNSVLFKVCEESKERFGQLFGG